MQSDVSLILRIFLASRFQMTRVISKFTVKWLEGGGRLRKANPLRNTDYRVEEFFTCPVKLKNLPWDVWSDTGSVTAESHWAAPVFSAAGHCSTDLLKTVECPVMFQWWPPPLLNIPTTLTILPDTRPPGWRKGNEGKGMASIKTWIRSHFADDFEKLCGTGKADESCPLWCMRSWAHPVSTLVNWSLFPVRTSDIIRKAK